MKWVIFLSLGSLLVCEQQTSGSKNDNADKNLEVFNSKYVRLIEDISKMMLIENVVICYGDFYLEADSALLEKPIQTVTAFGIKKARFKGNEIAQKDYTDMIRYKKGESRFYTD